MVRKGAAHEKQREAWQNASTAAQDTTPLDYAWISKCIGDALDPQDVVVTEIALDPTQACSIRPGTFFNHSHAGVLGWSPGAALGAKLARTDRTVICAVGDGSHVFGVPTATRHTARACNLPVLFVVYNNAGWDRTRRTTLGYAPEGWADRNPSMPLCDLTPPPAYDAICEANGGCDERVEEPTKMPAGTGAGARRGTPGATTGAARRDCPLTVLEGCLVAGEGQVLLQVPPAVEQLEQ